MTTLQIAKLGVRVEIRRTAQDTAGELFEFDVVGRARGFLTQAHVHTRQTERHEVIEGAMRLVIEGREHVLRQGEALTVPAGAAHRQLAGPDHDGPGRVRVQLRPAGDTEAFMRRLVESTSTAGASHARSPPPGSCATSAIPATPHTRPCASSARFPARSSSSPRPSTCSSTSGTSPPRARPCSARWTLTATPDDGTHVRFDWRVHGDRALLRVLTPVLRPALRWNHAWAIARAVDGLEPYARARAAIA